MGKKVRVALAQMSPRLGAVSENIAAAVSVIEEAARAKADIILFPELYFTGYQMESLGSTTCSLGKQYFERIDGVMAEAAGQYGIHIIAGMCSFEGDACFNAARLYSPQGICTGEYRKVFAFGKECEFFQSGQSLPVFQTSFGTIGILICYDIGFPETARKLSLAGAEILFVPSAWRIQDVRAWELNVPSRALENQCYTVGVNHAGIYGDLHMFGHSMVCGPDGNVMLQLGYDRPMLGICDIDLSVVQPLRQSPGYQFDYLHAEIFSGALESRCGSKSL